MVVMCKLIVRGCQVLFVIYMATFYSDDDDDDEGLAEQHNKRFMQTIKIMHCTPIIIEKNKIYELLILSRIR